MSFRNQLAKRYHQKCLISRYHYQESDGIHIIPRFISEKLNMNDLNENPDNGLFMYIAYHRTYDDYIWTFDVYQTQFSDDFKWCHLPIIIHPKYKNRSISNYENQLIKINVNSLPYLWVDFQVFLWFNFNQYGHKKGNSLVNYYAQLLNSDQFKQLIENPLSIIHFKNMELPQAIINHRSSTGEYLVIDYHSPWSQRRWLHNDHLSVQLVEQYHSVLEEREDKNYHPNFKKINQPPKVYNLRSNSLNQKEPSNEKEIEDLLKSEEKEFRF